MGTKRCLACADAFQPCPQVPAQNYCSRTECQKERRKLWQREKRMDDADYHQNQVECQRRWREANSDYWREYRADHPEYAQRNREKQRQRNGTRQRREIAKMDASAPKPPFTSGTYLLQPRDEQGIANMDAWIVQITVLAGT